MRLYIRISPRMVEEKLAAGYTLAQVGAYAMLLTQAEQQPHRGRFKSLGVLRAAMDCIVEQAGRTAKTSHHIPFLLQNQDIERLDTGEYYVPGWDEWNEGDLSPRDRGDVIRKRRGITGGDPGSSGARRTARWRSKGELNGASQAPSDASLEPASQADPSLGASLGRGDVFGPVDNSAPPVQEASPNGSLEASLERHRDASLARAHPIADSGKRIAVSGGDGGAVTGPASGPRRERANGLTTERPEEHPDVKAYGERFIEHGRQPSAADLDFLRRIPLEYNRLSRAVVVAAIDDVAAKHLAQGKPMPVARYLVGRLGDLQATAADNGIVSRGQPRSASGPTAIGSILQSLTRQAGTA